MNIEKALNELLIKINNANTKMMNISVNGI
jgi:hypothetical protein